jgi:RHS repeat-associated protein
MRAADTHFFLHDANYNIVAAVEDSTNNVVERYSYTPYGEVTVLDADFSADTDNVSDIGNTHFYTGRERDAETGLQLNGERFYAPHLGRWLQRDPIGYAGGINLYSYGQGEGTTVLDPQGTKPLCYVCSWRDKRTDTDRNTNVPFYVMSVTVCIDTDRSACKACPPNDPACRCEGKAIPKVVAFFAKESRGDEQLFRSYLKNTELRACGQPVPFSLSQDTPSAKTEVKCPGYSCEKDSAFGTGEIALKNSKLGVGNAIVFHWHSHALACGKGTACLSKPHIRGEVGMSHEISCAPDTPALVNVPQ